MKHFVRITLVALSLFSVPVLAETSQQPVPGPVEATITVKVGSIQTLKAPGATRIALGNNEYADVSVTQDGLISIEGLKAGETRLIVWTGKAAKTYAIRIE